MHEDQDSWRRSSIKVSWVSCQAKEISPTAWFRALAGCSYALSWASLQFEASAGANRPRSAPRPTGALHICYTSRPRFHLTVRASHTSRGPQLVTAWWPELQSSHLPTATSSTIPIPSLASHYWPLQNLNILQSTFRWFHQEFVDCILNDNSQRLTFMSDCVFSCWQILHICFLSLLWISSKIHLYG